MRSPLSKALVFCIALWSVVLLPGHALAQTASLSCSNGAPVANTQLFDTGGVTNDDGFCKYTGLNHIFSQVICNFVIVLNNVLGVVYCSMQYALAGLFGMVVTVFIAIFGIQLLMGTSQLTAKEFIVRLLKIGVAYAFITEAAFGIGYAFYFFFSLATEGVRWVMLAIDIRGIADTASICYDPLAAGADGIMSVFVNLDEIMCKVVTGPFTAANEKVIGFFTLLGGLMWPIGGLIVYWLILNLSVIVRGLVTFLLGMSALAFLIAMAPIFLSLMLFQTTYRFFETWLRFMISFTLQIILIFAVVALWMLAMFYFIDFFNDLSDTIQPYQVDTITSAQHTEHNEWGICYFNYYNTDPTGVKVGPVVNCISPPGSVPKNEIFSVANLLGDKSDGTNPTCKNMDTGDDHDCPKYLYYILYHLVTLIIVCYAFEALMRQAPMIAVYLAGPEYVPLLGQGFGVNRHGQFRQLGGGSGGNSSPFFGGGGKGAKSKGVSAPPAGSNKALDIFNEQMKTLIGTGGGKH